MHCNTTAPIAFHTKSPLTPNIQYQQFPNPFPPPPIARNPAKIQSELSNDEHYL